MEFGLFYSAHSFSVIEYYDCTQVVSWCFSIGYSMGFELNPAPLKELLNH